MRHRRTRVVAAGALPEWEDGRAEIPRLSRPRLTGPVLWVSAPFSSAAPAGTPWPRSYFPGASGTTFASTSGSGPTTGVPGARSCETRLDATLCFAPLPRWVLT